jgi:hypothetical protein
VESFRVEGVETVPDLQASSLQWMRDRAIPFMVKFLTSPPFHLPLDKAEFYAPELRDFWATIAAGDNYLDFPHLPPEINQHLQAFGAVDRAGNYQPIDNAVTLQLSPPLGS